MSNDCDCPKPPGGRVTCSDHQLAVCAYRDGEIVSGCFDPPEHAGLTPTKSAQRLANWTPSITGTDCNEDDAIKLGDLDVLQSGKYRNVKTGEILRFTLLREIANGVALLRASLMMTHLTFDYNFRADAEENRLKDRS